MILSSEALNVLLDSLTDKEIRFCQYYVISLKKAESARKAGYSVKHPGVAASEVLRKPNVKAYIKHLQTETAKRLNVTLENVIKELALVAFSSADDFLEDDGLGGVRLKEFAFMSNVPAIKKIKIKQYDDPLTGEKTGDFIEVDTQDKMKALELLGKHLAAFTDNVNLSNKEQDLPKNTTVVNIEINHRKKGEKLK